MESLSKIIVKWSGQEFEISVTENDTVLEFKEAIHKATGVHPQRQKLLNLKLKGKAPSEECRLGQLHLRPGLKIMMMGSREEDIEAMQRPPEKSPEVLDDLVVDDFEELPIEKHPVYLAKIERRVREYTIKQLNEFREGKRLLVLDIDYTLFDHRSVGQNANELMRPYLHEFLTSAYEDYDIAIWSATSMKWIEEKMRVLGVTGNSQYKIAFHLDSSAMISVYIEGQGLINVKPLGVIWGKFPQFSEKNTIMFDDIKSNFLMNPKNGLAIKAFRNAHFTRDKDDELLHLSKFLRVIARHYDDFSKVNHYSWKSYNDKYP